MTGEQHRELQEALLEADAFEDLPGKWQAAALTARRGPAEAGLRSRE
jgi:hypothetical protein